MRVVIIANGQLSQAGFLQPTDIIIAADGGAHHCLNFGIYPDYIIGDLDSLDKEQIDILKSNGAKFIAYPTRKDYTDLELALQHARELGASEILILGALGARWDQTIANILLPGVLPSLKIHLIDGLQEMRFLHSNEELEIVGQPGDLVSLIPLAGDAIGVTTQNLEYPLTRENLIFGSTRGISNVLIGNRATISLQEGLLLCVTIHSA